MTRRRFNAVNDGSGMDEMNAIEQLRGKNKMTWIEEAQGWLAAPEDIVDALANEGFVECKRATTTSRRDLRPTGGIWQGVNRSTGSVASTIWVDRPSRPETIVFVTIDGEAVGTPESRNGPEEIRK
jgi:hypothetical protein